MTLARAVEDSGLSDEISRQRGRSSEAPDWRHELFWEALWLTKWRDTEGNFPLDGASRDRREMTGIEQNRSICAMTP
jgi:hypothetical protein